MREDYELLTGERKWDYHRMSCIRAKSGTVIEDSGVREEIDRALIRQFDLLPVARKMVMEELANGQQN